MMDPIKSFLVNQAPEVHNSNSEIKSLETRIRELKLQVEFQDAKYKQSLADRKLAMHLVEKLQEEVEYYYLLSEQKQKIIESLEELQAKSTEVIYNYVKK
ncbi:hypothetical protein SynA1562_00214 [Synechococcus sp. A15-62]|nr:hypothetical protein SynA1562_00214 [Synechococcus sp. A15-62]